MIHSILDTDLYKLTTSYAYMKLFPDAECTFTYVDRNKVKRSPEFLEKFKDALNKLAWVQFTETEFIWCRENIRFIPEYYWEWLKTFHFDPSKIISLIDEEGVLHVTVTDKCYRCTLYEIPILYLVPEISNADKEIDWDKTIKETLFEKIKFANKHNIKFSEFGTRRRFNYDVQDSVVEYISKNSKTCVGTSNVHLAMKYGMMPSGTHPHEWFMFHAAQYGYKNANYLALEDWVKVYDGDLGIALTDTFTSDAFFRNFSLKQAKLFDGIRQDSGDEYEFVEKAISFYKSKRINPNTKTIIFSNGLDFNKANNIANYCLGRINAAFGIGTNLTCDVYNNEGVKFPYENEVMKMTRCRMNESQPWYECIKLSDDIGKHLGSNEEIQHAIYELGI